jgi:hypothetical protein
MTEDYIQLVKELLNGFATLRQTLDLKLERMVRLEERATSPAAGELTGMPTAHIADLLGIRVSSLADMKDELKEQFKEQIEDEQRKKKQIEHLVSKLTVPVEQTVIQMRYIDGFEWEAVNESIFGRESDFADRVQSYMRRIFRAHGTAIYNMAKVWELEEYKCEQTRT